MSTYRVLPLDDARFAVADTANEFQFVGSLAECEEWLDSIDQVQRSNSETTAGTTPAPPGHPIIESASLWRRLMRLLFG